MHVETISTGNGRRIERIGSDPRIPGVRRIEWHEAAEPDGRFLRLPLADLVCTLNLGVVGEYRLPGERRWHAFPRIAARGISSAPSEGRDPAHGVLGYVSIVIAPWAFPIYTGLAAGPTVVNGEAAMLERVANLPGAIGYVRQGERGDAGVRTVTVTPEPR